MTTAFKTLKAYVEVIDFIAGMNPTEIASYRPSAQAKACVADLIQREKIGALSANEKSELDHYMQLEHLMRLAKARAREYISCGKVSQRRPPHTGRRALK